jgi:ABC-type multidrug transport system, permease component
MIDTPLGKRSFKMQTKALISKELRQILRDRELLMMLVVMPVMQITLYSLALSPEVEHLQLGVIDYASSPTSREFVARLVRNQVFDIFDSGGTSRALSQKVRDGQLDAGIIIPPDFERLIKSERGAKVQVLLDGVDANTAGIASGYIAQILQAFNSQLSSGTQNPKELIEPMVSYAYNPGLESKWFFVPGVLAMVLNLVSTLVSSAAVIREKDTGTLEQLLMTPVNSLQILIAKIVPLAIVLMMNVFISLFIAVFIYHIPFRGNLLLFLGVSLLAIIVGISLGISLAAFAANQRQSLLTSFFVNLPVIQLSGALTPVESMPDFWQKVAMLDPLRYYVACVKAIMLKGVGIEAIWKDVLALLAFAVILLLASSMRFRKQLQ